MLLQSEINLLLPNCIKLNIEFRITCLTSVFVLGIVFSSWPEIVERKQKQLIHTYGDHYTNTVIQKIQYCTL